jgi:hypothetical protein
MDKAMVAIQEKMKAEMDANIKKMMARLGNKMATIRAGQEQMGAKIKTSLEEITARVGGQSRKDGGHSGAL